MNSTYEHLRPYANTRRKLQVLDALKHTCTVGEAAVMLGRARPTVYTVIARMKYDHALDEYIDGLQGDGPDTVETKPYPRADKAGRFAGFLAAPTYDRDREGPIVCPRSL